MGLIQRILKGLGVAQEQESPGPYDEDSFVESLHTIHYAAMQDEIWADVERSILENIRRVGLDEISAEPGQEFDPHLHEAIGTAEGEDGTIVATARRGFRRLDGSVLCYPQVIVGDGYD
jgi:molecular chaperone GrpE (heat shock protein)